MPFSDRTKLKAKKKHKQMIKKIFEHSIRYAYGVCVTFSPDQQKKFREEKDKGILHFFYDSNWIKENLDYPTILNNFIYLFEAVDLQFRCKWCHKKAQLSFFGRFIDFHGIKQYSKGTYFDVVDMKSIVDIIGYSKQLSKNDIELEKVIEWFFTDYLKDEFGVKDYTFSIPSRQVSYVEKCKLLVVELERILKQFKLYVEEGSIDKELLQISSKQIKYEYIPSMIKNKYLYPVKNVCSPLMNLLFSDQSKVLYTEKFKSKYNTLYELIKHENLLKSDFFDSQIPSIEYLVEKNILNCGKGAQITLNADKAALLKDLYYNEVSRTDYVQKYLEAFDEQEQSEMFTIGETLFSKPEQEYLNYMLNNSEFSNGQALRNSYLHGTNPMMRLIKKIIIRF